MKSPRRLISTGSPMEAAMAYSRAVVQGDWCAVAGVTGYDYATMTLPEGAAAQTRNCFATIASVLGEAGFDMQHILRVTYFITDRGLVDEIAPEIAAALADIRPAASMIVTGLIRPEMLIEIEVTAFRG